MLQPVDLPLFNAALATLLVAAAAYLHVHLRVGDRAVPVDLTEAAIVVAVFGVAAPAVPLVVAFGVAIGEVARRRAPAAAALVILRWTCAAAGAAALYAALRAGWDFTGRNVVALVASMVVVGAINAAALLVTSRPPLRHLALEWLLSVPVGLMFAGAYATSIALVPLFVVPMALLHLAARGHSRELSHRERLEGLQSATRVLTQPLDPAEALVPFLDAVISGFRADGGALVIDGKETSRGAAPASQTELHVAFDAGRGAEGQLRVWRSDDAEAFTAEDATVLEAVARELASAIQRSELLTAVLDERRNLKQIVGSTSDGIFTIDRAGAITMWNPAMAEISGHPADSAVGEGRLALLGAGDAKGEPVDLTDWRDIRALPSELQIRHRDGDTRWLDCSYSLASGTNGETLVVIARDRTGAHELERLKQDFVSIVSHELRTPITPIKGFATALLRGGDSMKLENRTRALESILRQAQRLERLIMNLLEVSKLERGAAAGELENVDVGATCRNVAAELLPAWPEAQIEVQEAGGRAGAMGRELWVDHVVSNLVSNALKYGRAGSPVVVRVEGGADTVRVAVIDRGAGIPPEETERIFGRFERLHQHDMQAGSGLGLYIARQLAEAMGGSLTVTSVVGEGSTFELRLAAAPVAVTSR